MVNIKHKKNTYGEKSFDIVNNIFLTVSFLVVLLPLLYIIACSFSAPSSVMANKVFLWPHNLDLTSYKAVFKNTDVWMGYLNSILYLVVGTLISVSLTMLLAYPLSRKEFVGRNAVTAFIMFTILFSGGLIPLFLVVRGLGMYNTIWAIVIPNSVNVWNAIIARTYLQENITDELYDAAQIDGCSDIRFFFKMVLPLSGAIIAVLCLFSAVVYWNSYFDALVYLQDKKLFPLQIILRNILIINSTDSSMTTDIAAAVRAQGFTVTIKYCLIVVASIPLLAIYPFVQKFFVKGVMIGSVKG